MKNPVRIGVIINKRFRKQRIMSSVEKIEHFIAQQPKEIANVLRIAQSLSEAKQGSDFLKSINLVLAQFLFYEDDNFDSKTIYQTIGDLNTAGETIIELIESWKRIKEEIV